jgi:hypothetical protein
VLAVRNAALAVAVAVGGSPTSEASPSDHHDLLVCAVLRCGTAETQQTAAVQGGPEYRWAAANFHYSGDGVNASTVLVVEVFGERYVSGRRVPMGQVSVSVMEMDGHPAWFDLLPVAGCPEPQGQLQIRSLFRSPEDELNQRKKTTASWFNPATVCSSQARPMIAMPKWPHPVNQPSMEASTDAAALAPKFEPEPEPMPEPEPEPELADKAGGRG